ncbi:MAG: glycosyltransferase [bacterium]|nr:glycosyltransferase [bacterium]
MSSTIHRTVQQGPVPPKFIYVGRIEERKGTVILIKAFAAVLQKFPEASLTIAGSWSEDEYGTHVRSLIEAFPAGLRKQITITGEISKEALTTLFLQSYYCVIPSLWENSPYAFFETLSAGLYCIGAATGEMKEVLSQIQGSTFTPGRWESLEQELLQVITNTENYWSVLKRQLTFLDEKKITYPENLTAYYRGLRGE